MSDVPDYKHIWHGLTPKKRLRLIKGMVKGRRHKFDGDFMVVESGNEFPGKSLIMHLPSGLWKALSVNFSTAKRKLINMCDEERKDTIVWIHEV